MPSRITKLSLPSMRLARVYAIPRASFSVRAVSYTVRGWLTLSCVETTWILYLDFGGVSEEKSWVWVSSSAAASWFAR